MSVPNLKCKQGKVKLVVKEVTHDMDRKILDAIRTLRTAGVLDVLFDDIPQQLLIDILESGADRLSVENLDISNSTEEISADALIKAGYRRYTPNALMRDRSTAHFQRPIRDKVKEIKVLFINAYEYDFRQYQNIPYDFSYDIEIQTQTKAGKTLNLTVSNQDFKSIHEMELYITKFFYLNGGLPYET